MAALDDVWLGGDAAAILDCFEPDVVFFGSGEGEQAGGHDGLEAMLAQLSPVAEGSKITIEWDSLAGERLGNVGLISGVGHVRASGALEKFDGNVYRVTGVLVKRDGTWRWKLYHGSEPASWA